MLREHPSHVMSRRTCVCSRQVAMARVHGAAAMRWRWSCTVRQNDTEVSFAEDLHA